LPERVWCSPGRRGSARRRREVVRSPLGGHAREQYPRGDAELPEDVALEAVAVRDSRTGARRVLKACALFVFIRRDALHRLARRPG